MPRSSSNLSNERRSSTEPDLVKDVPENAVGSPETPTGGLLTEQDAKKTKKKINLLCLVKGFIDCLSPVLSFYSSKQEIHDVWEIPFDEITEIQWLGSGAQGAVFLGKWRNKEVAIKKVRKKSDADIIHLRGLDHENVVKFR